jgi:hypothetical protein
VGEPGAIDRASWLRPAALVKTVVHPHKVSRFLSVVIVALDLTRLRIGWVPGADDPKVDEPEPGAVRGLIPDSAHSTALCVMNGGWQPRHGRWGMMRAGVVLVPPRPDGCTVAVHDSGRVSVGPWPEVEPVIGELSAYRQTPPCLLHEGMLHPELERNNERRWGGRNPKRKTRRRSAIGIDASGTVLLFAVGIEVGAKLLAEALRHAGAASAAELDINWYWTRFLLFGNAGSEGAPRVTSKLLPGMEYAASEYVSRPSERDFFYAAIKESAVPGRAAPEQR